MNRFPTGFPGVLAAFLVIALDAGAAETPPFVPLHPPGWSLGDRRVGEELVRARNLLREGNAGDGINLFTHIIEEHRHDVLHSVPALRDLLAWSATAQSKDGQAALEAYLSPLPIPRDANGSIPFQTAAEVLLWTDRKAGGKSERLKLRPIRHTAEATADEGVRVTMTVLMDPGQIFMGSDLRFPFGDAIEGKAEVSAAGTNLYTASVYATTLPCDPEDAKQRSCLSIDLILPKAARGRGPVDIAGTLLLSQPTTYSVQRHDLRIGSNWKIGKHDMKISSLVEDQGRMEVSIETAPSGDNYTGEVDSLVWLESPDGRRCIADRISSTCGHRSDGGFSNWVMSFPGADEHWTLVCLAVAAVSTQPIEFTASGVDLR